jgi:hypothetical protein
MALDPNIVTALEKERDRFVYAGAREKVRCRTLDEAIKIVRTNSHSPAQMITALEAERDHIVYFGSRELIRCDALDSAIKIVTATTATTTITDTDYRKTAPRVRRAQSIDQLQDIMRDIKRDLEELQR